MLTPKLWLVLPAKGRFRGEPRGAEATPFSLKFCIIVNRIFRKIKSIYIAGKWASVPITIFWILWIWIFYITLEENWGKGKCTKWWLKHRINLKQNYFRDTSPSRFLALLIHWRDLEPRLWQKLICSTWPVLVFLYFSLLFIYHHTKIGSIMPSSSVTMRLGSCICSFLNLIESESDFDFTRIPLTRL